MITHSKKRPICKDFVMNLISLKITENLRYHLVLVLFCFASIAQPLFAQQEDVNFDAIPTATDTPEQKAALTEAINVYKRGDFLRSSLSLYEIIREKEMASNPIEEQAEYTLGKTLYRLNLYQAAFEFFIRIVKAGPQHRYFKATCKWLYYLSRKLPGDDDLLKRIASYKSNDCPLEFRNEISFLKGQYHYKRGEIDEAISSFAQVSRDNVLYLKAKFIQGVSFSRSDRPQDAEKSFKDILRYAVDSLDGLENEAESVFKRKDSSSSVSAPTSSGEGSKLSTARLIDTIAQGDFKRDLKYFSQLAVLNLARLFYEMKQYRNSLVYYDYVPMNSFVWIDALFESSWTLFKMGPEYHEKALGNLQTLSSPFFKDEYAPESPILKAVILYSRCEYEKAVDAVKEFRDVYEPLLQELDGYVKDFSDPAELYRYLRKMQESGSNVSPRVGQILNALFQDRELKRINAHVSELERELALINKAQTSWADSELATYVKQTIEYIKEQAFARAGDMAKKRLNRIVEELSDLRSKTDAIDIEVSTSEKTDAQLSLSGVELERKLQADAKKRTPDDEHIYWAFDGEYWRDELGYYLYSINSKCGR
jgi:tetratricopeptide (TPR) repeat protein